jgi:integrase/recombinase XerD
MKQDKPFKITTYLNKRQKSKTIKGHYSCYVRVYPYDRRFPHFFVTTNLSCSIDQYDNMFVQARTKLKPTNTKKFNAIMKMIDKAETLNNFAVCRSPQAFKDMWKGVKSSDEVIHGYTINVYESYDAKISELRSLEKWASAKVYENSRTSLTTFFKTRGKDFKKLSFYDLTENALNLYKKWNKDLGNTKNTTGFHLRPLMAVFNKALDHGSIDKKDYPFGKKKVTIPKGSGTNRGLEAWELKAFAEYGENPKTKPRKLSWEIWMLSYYCGGVNFKDLCYLKHRDVKEDTIVFDRSKTEEKDDNTIVVPINEFIARMLKKHKGRGVYAFNFVSHKLESEARWNRYMSKLRGHTDHWKNIAKEIGITVDISYYWGRHSFATKSRDDGKDMYAISEAMGHSSIAITEAYFNRISNDKMKDLQDNAGKF